MRSVGCDAGPRHLGARFDLPLEANMKQSMRPGNPTRTAIALAARAVAAVASAAFPLAALASERCPALAVPLTIEQRYIDKAVQGAEPLLRYVEMTEPMYGYDFEDIVTWLDTLRANHCAAPAERSPVANEPARAPAREGSAKAKRNEAS
jgi:hypothetical protein